MTQEKSADELAENFEIELPLKLRIKFRELKAQFAKKIKELEAIIVVSESATGLMHQATRIKKLAAALNKIAILASGELAFTREFTEQVEQICMEALDVKKKFPY